MASGAREPRRSRVMYALLHLEAGDARLQTVRGVVEALDGRVRLTQRLHRLLRRLVELDHGLLDLLGGERLRLHTLVHAFEARRERLHLLDDLHELHADRFDFLHAAPHLFGEFLDAHHAGGDRRLHLLHHLLDVPGRDRGLVGETADLGGDHREALAVFTGLLGLDRGVERQEIGLIGHLGDGSHDGVDVAGLLVEHLELGGNGHRGLDHVVHGGFHLVETGLTVGGGRGGSLGDACDLLHGAHQLLRGGGDLRGGRDDLVDRGGLLGGVGDLGGGRRHLYAGLLHLIHERTQVLHHTLHALAEFADGNTTADVEVAREITFCGARHHAEDRNHQTQQFLECLAAFLHEAAQVVHHLLQTRAEFADRIFPGETHLTREVAHCGLVDHTEQDVLFFVVFFCVVVFLFFLFALAIGGTDAEVR